MTFAAFLVASLVLAATPGPGVVYIVARTLSQGRTAGLASVAGVAIGNLGNALGASIGLAAVFAVSSLAYDVVQLAGAAYLVFLGVQAWRRPRAAADDVSADASTDRRPAIARKIARDGALVALLNPKTALFFAAFLPQFIDPAGSALAQSAAFGAVFVALALVTDTIYALVAGAAAARWTTSPRTETLARAATSATFIGLGVIAALAGTRPTR